MLLKETAFVNLFGLTQIPMLFFLTPRVLRVDDEGAEIQLPLSFRSKNHLGSMYFGALACGADLAAGVNAALAIRQRYKGVQLIFKDLQADFLKRPDGDVHFTTQDGRAILDALAQAATGADRVTLPVSVTATVPKKYGAEPVATFRVGLSLKKKG